jgi:hypothetical protein
MPQYAPVPSLSTKGFLRDPYEKADQLSADFFQNQASQTNFYKGEISSLTFLLNKHSNDSSALRAAVKDTLTTLFSRYFDMVEVDVTIQFPETKADSRFDLRVELTFMQNGITYNLGKLVEIVDSKLNNVVGLINAA